MQNIRKRFPTESEISKELDKIVREMQIEEHNRRLEKKQAQLQRQKFQEDTVRLLKEKGVL